MTAGYIPPARIRAFQKKILTWYRAHGRHDLPWRRRPTPYRVLVSEIMLQQTQVSRVAPKYLAFLKQFPNWQVLAGSSTTELLSAWSGLGYNRRALMLRHVAKRVMRDYRGRLPSTYEALRELPGIGPYTARAVNVFARNRDEVCLDTNVRRVLLYELKLSPALTVPQIEVIAQRVLPSGRAREWHSALMDYGALIATSRKTGVKPLGKPQGKFLHSPRYYRGKIIQQLLEHKELASRTLARKLEISSSQLRAIADGLKKEGLIETKRDRFQLSP